MFNASVNPNPAEHISEWLCKSCAVSPECGGNKLNFAKAQSRELKYKEGLSGQSYLKDVVSVHPLRISDCSGL